MTQKPNALTLHQLGHLLDPSSHSSIAPPTVTWIEEKEKSNAGTSNVVNGIAELGDGTLRIHFNTPRPYLVLLQYLVAGVSVRRVCLNQHHNGLPPTARAHMHTYIPATGGNHCAALDTIAVPPIGAPRLRDRLPRDIPRLCGPMLGQHRRPTMDRPARARREVTGMDIHSLRTAYLDTVNDGLQAFETPDGFMVWVPLYHSDGDGVTLTVRHNLDGWIVTDDGSTYSWLRSMGAPVDSAAFIDAWTRLSRPGSGFIPNDGSDAREISAWGEEPELGILLNDVALASVRAEGLSILKSSGQTNRFDSTVRERLRFLSADDRAKRAGFSCGSGRVAMKSGRTRHVAALVMHDDTPVAAFQALAGRTSSARESSFEHCYALFSQAELEHDRRIAVIASPDQWQSEVLSELRDVATVLPWNIAEDVDQAFWSIVDNQPINA